MNKDHLKKIWTGPETGDPKPIIYLGGDFGAGTFWNNNPADLAKLVQELRFICQSYYYSYSNSEVKMLDLFKKYKVRCFLDSGAFSYQMEARRRGHPITQPIATGIIDQYIDWIYNSELIFDFVVTFDYARDPAITDWATKQIEARGLHPLPVYHYGAPIVALQELVDRYPFIGIGGMIGTNTKYLRPFLDHVFNLTEKHGTHLHGFGVGGSLIAPYPWFSVDSTTWLQEVLSGTVRMPGADPSTVGDKVPTSERKAVRKNDSLESYYQRTIHNIRQWVRYMYRLDARNQKPQAKRSLF